MDKLSVFRRVLQDLKFNAGLVVVCVMFLIGGSLALNQTLVYTPDSARYLAWSHSLSHFKGFIDETTPEPSRYVVHAPLYPLLIAPTSWISDVNVVPAKFVTSCFGVALLMIVYFWSRNRIGKRWALLLCSLLAINPAMVLYSTQVLSDVPFAVCVFASFMLLERETIRAQDSASQLISLIAVIVCGVFLREVGLALIVASVAILLSRKLYKEALLVLAVTACFYLLWYVRNEVIVARIEHPSMQNTQLIFRHLFTASDTSIFAEFLARMRTNGTLYGFNIIQLPFVGEVVFRAVSIMAPSNFPLSIVLRFMPYCYLAFLILTAVLMIVGVYAEWKNKPRLSILGIFLVFYILPILIYPITDSRFLFPVLIIVLYFLVVGFRFVVHRIGLAMRIRGLGLWPAAISFAILALPNIAWTSTYISNSWRSDRSPLGFYEEMRHDPAYPALFARPLSVAGAWIAEHSDSSSIVLTRWKELGVYTKGRKVIDIDPMTLPDVFEAILRDYKVQYVVSVVSRGGLREFELLFAEAQHFHFSTETRIADLEIDKVEQGPAAFSATVSDHDSTEGGVRLRFARAIRELENDHPHECETILRQLPLRAREQLAVVLSSAVAKEIAGEFDVADTMFSRFHGIPQAGTVIDPVSYHLEIIARLRQALKYPLGSQRAQALQLVASYYWVIGFHSVSLATLDKSIESDSLFFPSLIFRGIYSLLNGDTVKSQQFLNLARQIDPSNILVVHLSDLLRGLKDIETPRDSANDRETRLNNVRDYEAMGLRENAIDDLLNTLRHYPDDQESLRMLVDLYYKKGRFAPALAYLERLAAMRPEERELREEIVQLRNRW